MNLISVRITILLINDYNLVLANIIDHNRTFFVAFTQREFGYILYHVVVFSMYFALASFALTLVSTIISIFYTKEMHQLNDKLTATVFALLYGISIAYIFAISVVSISGSFKHA